MLKPSLAALAITLVGATAQAATMSVFQSQTGSFGASQEAQGGAFVSGAGIQTQAEGTNTTLTRDDRAATMTFDQFDASLGTLTGVTVKYSITQANRNSIQHLRRNCETDIGGCSILVDAKTNVDYGIDIAPFETASRDSNPPLDVSLKAFGSLSDTDPERSFALTGSQSRTFPASTATRFIGDGTIDIQPIVQAVTQVKVSCQGSIITIDLKDCNGDVQIRYNIFYRVDVLYQYEETVVAPDTVPLPAGLPLLAIGLLGLGAFARRG